MRVVKEKPRFWCDKFVPIWNTHCGTWSLKHNEYYVCDECYKKGK